MTFNDKLYFGVRMSMTLLQSLTTLSTILGTFRLASLPPYQMVSLCLLFFLVLKLSVQSHFLLLLSTHVGGWELNTAP
jgi:hypothetical protein